MAANIPTTNEAELFINGENVQNLYTSYRENRYLVNRRYQRKLVWTIEEKQAFIDSLSKSFPVPLVLLAEVIHDGKKSYEIIDGMQRLNAIMSFIENDYSVAGGYFDLETMADTKYLKDRDILVQREPVLDRETCVKISRYTVPISTYKFDDTTQVDEVFRRINSNGKHLSKQELRQAGATGVFANLVRNISASIRGDSSASDILRLNLVQNISITGRKLDYGIPVDEIFWVKHGILTRENVRNSRDEELISDILAYILTDGKSSSSSDVLDEIYGLSGSGEKSSEIELAVKKRNPDIIFDNFIYTYNLIREALVGSDRNFNNLISDGGSKQVPRYFQAIFLAIYELAVEKDKIVLDNAKLIRKLDGIGRNIDVGDGGGRWSASSRKTNVDATVGIIKNVFGKRRAEDPARANWVTQLENILMQSHTEQTLYDFKIGLHSLDPKNQQYNDDVVHKVVNTLIAMGNNGPELRGYVLLGVADKREDAEKYDRLYKTKSIEYNGFYVTGVEAEAIKHYGSVDKYFQFIHAKVQGEPIDEVPKSYIGREMRVINYYDKSVVLLRTKSHEQPYPYNGKWYERRANSLHEIPAASLMSLLKRFG